MFNIQKYLEKFSKNIQSKQFFVDSVLSVIKKHTAVILSCEEIEIKNYIVYLKTSPAVANKVFIYKNKILDDISQNQSFKIIDIR